jgi:hypothetical protein
VSHHWGPLRRTARIAYIIAKCKSRGVLQASRLTHLTLQAGLFESGVAMRPSFFVGDASDKSNDKSRSVF